MVGQGDVNKRVKVFIENYVKGKKELKQYRKDIKKISASLGYNKNQIKKIAAQTQQLTQKANISQFYDRWTKKLKLNQAQVKKAMSSQGMQFDQFGQVVDQTGRKATNVGSRMAEGARKTKPFRMELLGVMFAGMAVNRAFSRLNQTAMEWTGIGELMSVTMGDLMLPATMDLLNYGVIPFSDAMMGLPEPMKKVIGYLSLLGQGAGMAVMSLGQLGLAMGAMDRLNLSEKLAFGNVKAKVGGFLGKVKGTINSKWARMGAATLLLGLALKDAAEGQLLASLGGVGMAVGALGVFGKASPWLIGIGFSMKLLGDAEFTSTVLGAILGLADKLAKLGEMIGQMLWDAMLAVFTGKEFKLTPEMTKMMDQTVEKANIQSDLFKTIGSNPQVISPGGGLNVPGIRTPSAGSVLSNLNSIRNKNNSNSSSQSPTQNIFNQSYNINVSDKREFDSMLEKNNTKLMQDVRREVS